MRGIKRKGVKFMVSAGALLMIGAFSSGAGAEAASGVSISDVSKTLTIKVKNGNNVYEKYRIKIKKAKNIVIKKVKYKSKNSTVAMVTSKGRVVAMSPGNTVVTATIKYKKKNAENKTLKKKKITINITVKAKKMVEVPQTEMQYDETGKAKPLYPFTDQFDEGMYSDETSYIKRFPVYVETDHDTDMDGRRDLILAYVQVPESAVKGYYKAPVIMEANPYLVNGHRSGYETEKEINKIKDGFNYALLETTPEPRVPEGEITTAEAASGAAAWIRGMTDEGYVAGMLDLYRYYIIRGYAYVTSPGLGGSKESEGLQMCGEKLEAEGYASIIEWLHGDRPAYADKEGTLEIKADWCSGHTCMTGLSYVGSLAYEVSTLGVEGLDTVIPEGAISNWYDYVYDQGIIRNDPVNYMTCLGDMCAKKFYYETEKEKKNDPLYKIYKSFSYKRNFDSTSALGEYGDFWKRYDYRDDEKPTVPALIVEGLNDTNVTTKQTEMMRKAYADAGQNVKVILHQGAHDLLSSGSGQINVNGENYDDLVNRWLSHYLCGIDNGVENIKDYIVQSNVDGTWTAYDEGSEKAEYKISPTGTGEKTISYNRDDTYFLDVLRKEMTNKSNKVSIWEQKITEDITISGHSEVHIRAKLPETMLNFPAMSVMLVDEYEEKFKAFTYDPDYGDCYALTKTNNDKPIEVGEGIDECYEMEFVQKKTNKKLISMGMINLLMPGCDYDANSCKMPETPVSKDTYYDYTLYLDPTVYTLKKGHTLKLYVLPRLLIYGLTDENLVNKYTDKLSCTPLFAGKYKIVIDEKNSYASLPVTA